MSLDPFAPGRIWTRTIPLRFAGIEMGARMTVIRLENGALFVHSPVRLDVETRRAVDALGPVRFLVAPNKLHHLFLAEWARAYPEARLFAAPGLARKRPDLAFEATLTDAAPGEWASTIEQAVFRGSLFMDEVVFLHRAAKTLIVADLLEQFGVGGGPARRFLAWLAGVSRAPGLTFDQRALIWRRRAARAFVARVLDWDFERIILAHGPLVLADAKRVFRAAYRGFAPGA